MQTDAISRNVMSRRSPIVEKESRPSLSRNVRMALSYLALLIFTLFAVGPIVGALELLFGAKVAINVEMPFQLTSSGNAALVALAVAITGTAASSLLGFAFSRRNLRPRSATVARSPLPQILVPLILLAPLVFVLFRFGQFTSFLWTGVVYLLTALPVCSWQLMRAYERISPAAEEAAAIDGCGSWRSFYSIIYPAVAPALILTALFSFVVAWNDYFVLGMARPVFAPGDFWSRYSALVLLIALFLGLGLWLFGRNRAAES